MGSLAASGGLLALFAFIGLRSFWWGERYVVAPVKVPSTASIFPDFLPDFHGHETAKLSPSAICKGTRNV